MRKELRKYIFQLTFLLVFCEIIGYVIFKTALPAYYFSWYPYIMVFFFVLGIITIFSMINATQKESRKYFNTFMLIKTGKLLSIIIAVALYALLIKENTISFLFTFFAYYLIYSIFETQVSTKLNRNNKNESLQQ